MSFCRQEVLFALLDHNIVYLQGKRVCLFTHYTIMCIFDVVFILEALCLCVSSVGAGTVMDGKHTPILQPLWPCSLTPYSYIFFPSLHTLHLPPPSRRQTHTHAHAPTAPVAPPRLLRVEQGDPGPMRQAARVGGQPGENLPWFSLLKLFSSGWQIRGDTSTRGDCTQLRGWGWTTIICPPLMLVKLFLMLARREGLKYN